MKNEYNIKQSRIITHKHSVKENNGSISHSIEDGFYFSIFSQDCISPISFTGVGNGYFSDITGFVCKTYVLIKNDKIELYNNIDLKMSLEKNVVENIFNNNSSYIENITKQSFNSFLIQQTNLFYKNFENFLLTTFKQDSIDLKNKHFNYYNYFFNYFLNNTEISYDKWDENVDFFDLFQTKKFIDNHVEYSNKIKLNHDLNSCLSTNSISQKILKV